jgi:Flp pilus assembly pilin Flp
MTEYALLIGVLAVGVLGVVASVGSSAEEQWKSSNGSFEHAPSKPKAPRYGSGGGGGFAGGGGGGYQGDDVPDEDGVNEPLPVDEEVEPGDCEGGTEESASCDNADDPNELPLDEIFGL